MTDETLKLLQAAVRKRAGSLGAITPVAEDLCRIVDHFNSLHWHDRNLHGDEIKRLAEENRRLAARLAQLETASHPE